MEAEDGWSHLDMGKEEGCRDEGAGSKGDRRAAKKLGSWVLEATVRPLVRTPLANISGGLAGWPGTVCLAGGLDGTHC